MFWKTVQERLTENLLARRTDRWITGGIAVLLLALGFIAGRWTTLSNTATPIVFQEAPGNQSSEASAKELNALVVEKKPSGQKETATSKSPSVQPTVKAEITSASSQNLGKFVASVNGEKYYFPDCSEVRRIKDENKIWFDSEDEAKESGYEASVCVQKR